MYMIYHINYEYLICIYICIYVILTNPIWFIYVYMIVYSTICGYQATITIEEYKAIAKYMFINNKMNIYVICINITLLCQPYMAIYVPTLYGYINLHVTGSIYSYPPWVWKCISQ